MFNNGVLKNEKISLSTLDSKKRETAISYTKHSDRYISITGIEKQITITNGKDIVRLYNDQK